MTAPINSIGQPVGQPVPDWRPARFPARGPMEGKRCRLEPLDPRAHAVELFWANAVDAEGRNWTYLPYGPFATLESYCDWMQEACSKPDPLFFAVMSGNGRAVGVASFMRIDPGNGCIEVGGINFSPALQRTVAATEAMYLMMRHVFELGYRRYEWKCDALNGPSRNAARRLGFRLEGIFRQAAVVKGRNRDTAWHSILDSEWPALRAAFEQWLDSSNFDKDGRQRARLSDLTRAAIQGGPATP